MTIRESNHPGNDCKPDLSISLSGHNIHQCDVRIILVVGYLITRLTAINIK